LPEVPLILLAAAIEAGSEHPIAKAISQYSLTVIGNNQNPQLASLNVTNHRAIAGCGITASLADRQVRLGTERWLAECGCLVGNEVRSQALKLEAQAKTLVWLAVDNDVVGLIALADTPKADSREAIDEILKLGIQPCMITGDNLTTANAIAEQVGIQSVSAQVLPTDKAQAIHQMQHPDASKNRIVAMVGDGINDAPALVQADVGIAIGTGTDIAIEAADVTLMNGKLQGVAQALRLSRAVMRVIKQNLFWAFAYNIALIPIAAGVLAGWSAAPIYLRELHPIMAAFAMVLSDMVIVLNALRLRKMSL
jgi:Cu+-exporting ATPase